MSHMAFCAAAPVPQPASLLLSASSRYPHWLLPPFPGGVTACCADVHCGIELGPMPRILARHAPRFMRMHAELCALFINSNLICLNWEDSDHA